MTTEASGPVIRFRGVTQAREKGDLVWKSIIFLFPPRRALGAATRNSRSPTAARNFQS